MALPLAALKLKSFERQINHIQHLHHGIAACGIETALMLTGTPMLIASLHHGITACGIETEYGRLSALTLCACIMALPLAALKRIPLCTNRFTNSLASWHCRLRY